MKRRDNMLFAASSIVLILALIIAAVPLSSFAGGCLPNKTCPPEHDPQAVECASGQCYTQADDGYCVKCIPWI